MKKISLFVLMTLVLTGCGGSKEEAPAAPVPAETAASAGAKTVDSATAAAVKGKVVFEGAAPAAKQLSVKGNPECAVLHTGGTIASEELVVNGDALQNAFVYVKEGLEDYSFTPPSEPVTIENKGCVYAPHVAGVMVGQPVNFLNQDSTLHNIHSYPKAGKAFNLGLPLVGMKQTKKFDTPEIMVPLKCDVHPWMLGYVGVLPHPYYAVSGADGTFELKGLPPGTYTLEIWHEKLGTQTQQVTLAANETKEIGFKFQG